MRRRVWLPVAFRRSSVFSNLLLDLLQSAHVCYMCQLVMLPGRWIYDWLIDLLWKFDIIPCESLPVLIKRVQWSALARL